MTTCKYVYLSFIIESFKKGTGFKNSFSFRPSLSNTHASPMTEHVSSEIDFVEPPEAPVKQKNKKRSADIAIIPIDSESELPSAKRQKTGESKSDASPTSPYSLLKFKVDYKTVGEDFVFDTDAHYDLLDFEFSNANDNGTTFARFLSLWKPIRKVRMRDHILLVLKRRSRAMSVTHSLSFIVFLSLPIFPFLAIVMKVYIDSSVNYARCRDYTGISLFNWDMEDFSLEVPQDREGEEMAFNATLNFVLRNPKYKPGPRATRMLCIYRPISV